MYLKESKEKNVNETFDDPNDYFDHQYRTKSTTHLMSPDYVCVKSSSPTLSVRSSTSSLTTGTSPKLNSSSYLKISSPNLRIDNLSPTEDRFLMTIIRSPSTSPQRNQTNELSGTTTTVNNEDISNNNNNNFIKNKVTAALNHMKYRWVVKMRPNFRTNESPIHLLGKVYNGKEEISYDDIPRPFFEQSYTNFLKSFSQKIYFSYRKQFEPLIGSKNGDLITSDGGWGCMIRCAQMLLAQTLLVHVTNSGSKRNSIEFIRNGNRIHRRTDIYSDIIRLFGDFPNVKCPFGIHKIVELGTSHGIRPGEFFGPVSAAYCLKEAIENNQIPSTLRVYITQDSIIYRDDVHDLCSKPLLNSLYPSLDGSISNENNSTRWLTSVLILVPLRLGLNELDLTYEDYLKEALKLPQTVGIIGGSPRHAVYIVGFQDDCFIVLDPHFIQTTVNVLENTFDISSFSCSTPKKLTAKKMDPSCTLGFYCRDKTDFEMFCAQWNHICHISSNDRRTCPIFRIEHGTFQENHKRTLNYDYPSMNDDEDVFLRVTKLTSTTNSPLSLSKRLSNNGRNFLVNSTTNNISYRDSWDDAGRLLNENSTEHFHSLSDDYVFL